MDDNVQQIMNSRSEKYGYTATASDVDELSRNTANLCPIM